MDFKYSGEDEVFRAEFRSWLEANMPHDWRDDGELADPDTQSEFERRRAWHRKLYDAGWMCIHWPKEFGGRGATLMQQFPELTRIPTRDHPLERSMDLVLMSDGWRVAGLDF